MVRYFHGLLFQEEPLFSRMKRTVFRLGKKIPMVRREIDSQLSETRKGFVKSLLLAPEGHTPVRKPRLA